MAEARGHVSGQHDKYQVTFYGLSTCVWCRKMRNFLEEKGVDFDYVYVDLIHGSEREQVKDVIRNWNPSVSFPTVVIDDKKSIVGFKPDKLVEALDL
jgi:glutaredoxin